MLSKFLTGILMSLHLISPSKPLSIPQVTPPAIQIPSNADQASTNPNANDLSISDEVYADLALQHELDHVSVYYFDDNPKNTVSINADKGWDPASTIKLYVAMYAFDQVAAGSISLDQNVTIEDKNVVSSQSFPQGYGPLHAGDSASVYELLDRMITQSGNTSYNTLLDLLGRTKITKYAHDLGLVSSSIGAKLNLDGNQEAEDQSVLGFGPNTTNADDYARAFILINGKRIPGSTNLFDMLSRQKFNSMLPALLPKDVVVAHKTGELDPFYHDGGIVIGPKRKYILSVFSDMGAPSVVAHISDLVYTTDSSLVGNSGDVKATSEVPDAPLDPLVAKGEPQTVPGVLATNTQKVAVPKLTNADLGIRGSDLSSGFTSEQLPPVLIPANSSFHFLVTLVEKMRIVTNPSSSMKLQFAIENSKQDLAEANDLISKGQKDGANVILKKVGTDLAIVAKDKSVSSLPAIQSLISKVSETRFSILSRELNGVSESGKPQLIKEIAKQARGATEDVKPFIADAVKTTDLTQSPIVGQVVRTSSTSITVRIPGGGEVTTPVDNQISARDPGQKTPKVINPASIAVGSTIAIAGASSDKQIKPSFILTNISPDKSNQTPVTVLKVNPDKNTFVIVNQNGIPEQIDLTKDSVIKGSDTAVSLNNLKQGDVVVVHGESVSATPSGSLATPSATPVFPIATPVASLTPATATSGTGGPKSTNTPVPSGVSHPSTVPSTSTSPKVIKGDVIQVIQIPANPPTNKPKQGKTQTPVPLATPETKKKSSN